MKIAPYVFIALGLFGMGIAAGRWFEMRHAPTKEQMANVITGAAELGWRCRDVNAENTVEMCRQAVLDLIQFK